MLYLMKIGALKNFKGKYQDLALTSKKKAGKRKKRYIPDNIYNKYFGENSKI